MTQMPITSPQNDKLKTLRKLRQRRRDRDRLGQFVAEGEDLLAAADAAGWNPVERFAVSGSGLPGIEVDPVALQSRQRARVRHPDPGDLFRAVGGGPARPPLRLPPRRQRSGQRRDGAAVRGRVRRNAASRSGPAAPTRSARRRYARAWARSSRFRSRTPRLRRCPARRSHSTPTPIAPLADVASELPPDGQITLLVGAEREGLPDAVIAAADTAARIPIATESLNAAIAASVALYELTRRISAA